MRVFGKKVVDFRRRLPLDDGFGRFIGRVWGRRVHSGAGFAAVGLAVAPSRGFLRDDEGGEFVGHIRMGLFRPGDGGEAGGSINPSEHVHGEAPQG